MTVLNSTTFLPKIGLTPLDTTTKRLHAPIDESRLTPEEDTEHYLGDLVTEEVYAESMSRELESNHNNLGAPHYSI